MADIAPWQLGGANPNLKDDNGYPLLWTAADDGLVDKRLLDIAQVLLDADVDKAS